MKNVELQKDSREFSRNPIYYTWYLGHIFKGCTREWNPYFKQRPFSKFSNLCQARCTRNM